MPTIMRKQVILFLPTLLLLLLSACDGKNTQVEIKNEADLAGKRIAVSTGSIYDLELSKRTDILLERYSTTPDIIAAIKSGKVDVFKDDEIMLSPSDLRRHGLKKAFLTDQTFDVAYAFRLDDGETVTLFNRFLAESRQSGLYDEIVHRWFGTEEPDTVSMPYLSQSASGPTLFVGVSVLMAPMSFREGDQWKGFEIEILQRFAHYAGRPIDIRYYDLPGATAALHSGKIDVLSSSFFVTEERKKSVLFSDPHYVCHPAYFVLDNKAALSLDFWGLLKESFHKNLIVENRWRFIVDGLYETLVISVWSLLLGTLLAALVCWMRMSRNRWIRAVARIYIDFLRGVPLLVLLMMMFYVVLAQSGLNATTVAVISFSLVFAAYVSEMFRTAILSVGKGQVEAGIALGFTPLQTFFYIILPQAARAVLPVYKGEAVSLFKNTSIVGYIAIQDLTKASDLIRSRTFDAFFPLIVITIIYFILAWLLGKALDLTIKRKNQ